MSKINSILSVYLLFAVSYAMASEPVPEGEILAKRGDGVVTHRAFDARLSRIPPENRLATIRDRGRLQSMLGTMLLQAQMAAGARAAGYDQEPEVIDRMNLAAEQELANAWLQHLADAVPPGDFEALARENFLLNRERYMSGESIDVSHILVSTEERADEEAKARAEQVLSELSEQPDQWSELVTAYSEDPSAVSNGGSFRGVKKGDMVKPFEDAAFGMEVGEIAGPVKTAYGYHIIRLDAVKASEQQDFEDVKDQLVDLERSKHRERIRGQYLDELAAMDVEMTEEALTRMIERHFELQETPGRSDEGDSE